MWKISLIGVVSAGILYLLSQKICCRTMVANKRKQLLAYGAKDIPLSYGTMRVVDHGEGEVILSVHGIFGGYDQAYDTCKDFASEYRILAPSRFGYLGSERYKEGTPARQADAYAKLLDYLGIDRVFCLATSAGGSVALQFALRYPERVKGLILFCSAMPPMEKPDRVMAYAGPPAFMLRDDLMYLFRPLFQPLMGMKPSMVLDLFPVKERRDGVILDAEITNTDMERNFDAYPIESLTVPTLILHAKDDKLADFERTRNAAKRFPDSRVVFFETGGHMMKGHEKEVREAVVDFMKTCSLKKMRKKEDV